MLGANLVVGLVGGGLIFSTLGLLLKQRFGVEVWIGGRSVGVW